MLHLRWMLLCAPLVSGHMTIWEPSMFAFNGPLGCVGGDCDSLQVNPMGPGLKTQEEWWFRGPNYTGPAQLPDPANATQLPAGGTWNTEITCNKQFSKYGASPSSGGLANYDCCPNAPGPYHADPDAEVVKKSLISGCALGIADVTDPADATMDNIVIFSVQPDCVMQKHTSFDIPAKMPASTGSHSSFRILGTLLTFLIPPHSTANFYMTGFYCNITDVSSTNRIAAPKDPINCKGNSSACQSGAKKPLYAYNEPTNVIWDSNSNRPG
ncbi:hypothetical protein RQP46_002094 [Phenoliferia psychrophenolica]